MSVRERNSRLAAGEQRAIIDIGSNTVRMVIYGGPPRAPQVLYNEKVTARLGRGVAETGLLSAKAMTAARAALARYAMLLRHKGVKDVETVATAAVRDAANGAEFLQSLEPLGLKPRLLSGEEEAVTSAMGVIGAFPGARGIVADLGGGSLELVHIEGMHCAHGTSLPLGTLRLPQLRGDGPEAFSSRILDIVRASQWRCTEGEALYLVGGSHRAFASFVMHQIGWPLEDQHGFELSGADALEFCRAILGARLPAVVPGIAGSRLASLPDTAALLEVLLQEIRPARLVFSTWGLREGLIFRQHEGIVQRQDPLVTGVTAFTESLGSPAAGAAMVAGWTVVANPANGTSRENLRLAATMLALALQRVEPNLRAAQAIEWALGKRWIGVNAQGRAVMAACALMSAGRKPPPQVLERLASPAALHEGMVWGAAIRLCRRLSGQSTQVLSNSGLAIEGQKLVLSVREPFGVLFTDPIEKDLRVLAEMLGYQPEYRLLTPADAA